MQKVLRYGSLGLAATLIISACAPAVTTPPTDESYKSVPPSPATGQAFADDFAPAFPSDVTPLQLAPKAPQPPLSVKDQRLVLPTGANVSLDQLDEDLPPSIPQGEAGDWLSPMPGAIAEGYGQPLPGGPGGIGPGPVGPGGFGPDGFGPGFGPGGFGPGPIGPDFFGPGGFGAFPGVFPDLLTYNALARCLFYPYKSFWVPYLLVGDCYFPYAYSPFYDDALSGCYAYPLFYDDGDLCYPYTFLSSRYRYGYADWEYNWPSYRSKHNRRYDDDFRRYRSRWGSREFQGWLDNRQRDHKQDNWRDRAREHRRDNRPAYHDGKRPGNPRGNPQGNRPDRPDRDHRNDRDRKDRDQRNERDRDPRNVRPDRQNRPDYQQGQRPDRNPAVGPGQQPGVGPGQYPGVGQGAVREDRRGNGRQSADDGRGRSNRGGEQVERDRAQRPERQVRNDRGEGQSVRRGGQQQARQNDARGRQQQVRRNESRGGQKQGRGQGGRMRPAGMEMPEDEGAEE
ncbi:hypothetical protein D3C86_487250 [compost metagenome]